MPKRLMNCIRKVQQSGKSESEAWAICTKSTGLKKEKHSELINHLVSLATKLDEKGQHEMASVVDNILKEQVKLAATMGHEEAERAVREYCRDYRESQITEQGQEPASSNIGEEELEKYVRHAFDDLEDNKVNQACDILGKDKCRQILKQEITRPVITRSIHETITEPMPGEVPSADELEKWLKARMERRVNMVKLAAWEEEEDPTAGEEWKSPKPEKYDSYNMDDLSKAIIRTLELVKDGTPPYKAHMQAFREFGRKPFSPMFTPTTSELKGVLGNVIKKYPDDAPKLLEAVGLQDLLLPENRKPKTEKKPDEFEKKKKELEKDTSQFERDLKREQITEPMPGEVPSADELEKWLKANKLHSHLISLANKLDDLNLPEEATLLDTALEKEAQWQWMKEKGQQLKDWYQGEKNPNIDTRTALTKMRQNHWNLVKKLNTAYQLLTKSHKNIGKPEYLRDISSMIQNILKDIQKASADIQAIATQPAQQPRQQAVPQAKTPQPPTPPDQPVPPTAPGASIAPGAALVVRLIKLAVKLDAKGDRKTALKVLAQAQTATEWGQKGIDWFLGRGDSSRAQTDKQWSDFHWRVASVFKSAYDKLNAIRQYLNDPNTYPEKFQAVVNEIQTDLNTILGEIQNAGKPAPAETEEGKKTQIIQPADQAYALMADMTPEQQMQAVEMIKQLRGQTS